MPVGRRRVAGSAKDTCASLERQNRRFIHRAVDRVRPMPAIPDLRLRRLQLGLLALIAALVLDAIDIPIEGMDVAYDGVALALFGVAAFGIGQPGARSHGVVLALAWLPFAVRAVTFTLPRVGADWAASWPIEVALFAAFAISLLLLALTMVKLTKSAGISSSARWRRTAIQVGLLVLLPGLATSIFVTSPAQELPFKPYVAKLDGTWWKTALSWAVMGAAMLAMVDMCMSAWTTGRSAGRRIADD